MVLFPVDPLPSSISAPEIIDSILRYSTDAGYEQRRPATSRPRFRYTVDYLGKTTRELRIIRSFVMAHRMDGLTFQWIHSTAFDNLTAGNTTPVTLNYFHGLLTGQWVNISFGPPALVGQWPIQIVDNSTLALIGSVAQGAVPVAVEHYLPRAVARFQGDVWENPTKLIGPEALGTAGNRTGYFNFSLIVEEVF